MPIIPYLFIVNDKIIVDNPIPHVMIDSVNMKSIVPLERTRLFDEKNKYVRQCDSLGMSPTQAITALEQLGLVASRADLDLIIEAIKYFRVVIEEATLVEDRVTLASV